MIKRIELLVYFNYRSSMIQAFESLGASVQYVNKKLGYAVLYVDYNKSRSIQNSLKHMKGIKKVEESPQELLELDI